MSEKIKYEIERIIKTSPKILYNMLSTPSGLSEWFADDVNIKNDIYTFIWEGSEEDARLLSKKSPEYVKFQWVDDEDTDAYFEFRIKIDAMTNEVALIITDHADDDDEVEEGRNLWESQSSELKHVLGG
ncbi:MAG: START-like domain-containing protein [Bacteroidota bacterium]